MMVPGMMGKIFRVIPLIVIPCLLFSLVESLQILPAHLSHLPAPKTRKSLWARFQGLFAGAMQHVIRTVYRPMLDLALRWRYSTAAVGAASLILTVGMVVGGWTTFHFFPSIEADFISAAVTMPQGTPAIGTDDALSQLEAGADALTLPDHATGDLVSGDYYRRYLRDLHIEFAEALQVPLILHICGRTVDRMGYIAQSGMAAFHYDSKNEPDESMEAVDGKISLVGNINNPETLFAKGPQEVREEVVANLDAGVQMVGPECAIPLQTPIESLLAIRDTVLDWHGRPGDATLN